MITNQFKNMSEVSLILYCIDHNLDYPIDASELDLQKIVQLHKEGLYVRFSDEEEITAIGIIAAVISICLYIYIC
jgi:hypothetical protein